MTKPGLPRRALLSAGAFGLGLGAAATDSVAQNATAPSGRAVRPDVSAFDFVSESEEPAARTADLESVGRGPSRQDEVATAFDLIRRAPGGPDHMAVAKYFLDLKPLKGQDYKQEWAQRANPLITSFFCATNTIAYGHPVGDTTAWCAAFVGFCLMSAGKPWVFSPASRHYRNGEEMAKGKGRVIDEAIEKPRYGDVIVFEDLASDGKTALASGHVAFFLSEDNGVIEFLGGNQTPSVNGGAISTNKRPRIRPGRGINCFRRFE
jgi:hypothetical protein